ncbi:hypothetical protein P4114_07305 [Pseudomonas aeruginosa]|nr:hypothetical protein [Pseudomonas aeruginosa]MDF5977992.1 hypothetical protein [Pseudomonas aeruginosa]
MKFNTLLTEKNIGIYVGRESDAEYTSMYIFFYDKGFSENIRFNRKEAIIPLMGVYNFNKKTYSDIFGDPVPREEVDYSAFEIDWSL